MRFVSNGRNAGAGLYRDNQEIEVRLSADPHFAVRHRFPGVTTGSHLHGFDDQMQNSLERSMRAFRNVVTVLNASLGVNERGSCQSTAVSHENAPVIKE
jgi:hypothetical protein